MVVQVMVVQMMLSGVSEINYMYFSRLLYFATDRVLVIHSRWELFLCSPFFSPHNVRHRISTLEPSRLCL